MLILTIRTDKPEAELGLFDNQRRLAQMTWLAHRQLAETIHKQIIKLLSEHDKRLQDIEGIIAYKGPGSFTGLRIGLSTANAMADSLGVKIVGASSTDWTLIGIRKLMAGSSDKQVTPDYGAQAHTTTPTH